MAARSKRTKNGQQRAPCYTRAEAAALFGIHRATLWEWCNRIEHPLKYARVGRRIYFRPEWLDEFLKTHEAR